MAQQGGQATYGAPEGTLHNRPQLAHLVGFADPAIQPEIPRQVTLALQRERGQQYVRGRPVTAAKGSRLFPGGAR
jgi:hypothetical protein